MLIHSFGPYLYRALLYVGELTQQFDCHQNGVDTAQFTLKC
jgi:hypothetical protein